MRSVASWKPVPGGTNIAAVAAATMAYGDVGFCLKDQEANGSLPDIKVLFEAFESLFAKESLYATLNRTSIDRAKEYPAVIVEIEW